MNFTGMDYHNVIVAGLTAAGAVWVYGLAGGAAAIAFLVGVAAVMVLLAVSLLVGGGA